MKHWQIGLESFEHISGDPGNVGAKMKLNYSFKNKTIHLIETVTFKQKGKAYHFNFDMPGMYNIQENYFEAINENTTKWISKNQFVPTNFRMRFKLFLMPKTYKKQTEKYLIDFKNFAEHKISILDLP